MHLNDLFADCVIKMVGKPLFQRYTGTYWGAWMKDAKPKDNDWATKYWFTRHFTGKLLYEYKNLQVNTDIIPLFWSDFISRSKTVWASI